MVERRSIGRRFVDLRPDAPIPQYPVELERRHLVRRNGDRPPTHSRKARRRTQLLFCASWKCAWCGRLMRTQHNIPYGARRLAVVDPPHQSACPCPRARSLGQMTELEWRFQSGNESE